MDNFDPSVFKFDKCEEIFQTQCDNGKCVNKTMGFNDTELCSKNMSYPVSYWNPAYPSENYWR